MTEGDSKGPASFADSDVKQRASSGVLDDVSEDVSKQKVPFFRSISIVLGTRDNN